MVDLASSELELMPIVFVDNNNLIDDLVQDDDKELISIDDGEEEQNNEDNINEDIMIQKAALEVSQLAKITRNRSIKGVENIDNENDDDNSIDSGDYDNSDKENDEIFYSETSNQVAIRQFHNAFLRAERICELRNKSIDMSENSHKIIERNAANDLV
ncbi:hypothetical protein RclHR1_16130001 [Rhizophagus clarus]|uniref:Uncharacterized protein n=1 Tax=Rhizophagus clarus TaxID=94130 RepID=A0A2Z6R9R0_9GLOM|nr:hypothetical protein RclHR1_16130001 [Rhizophagus clarus]